MANRPISRPVLRSLLGIAIVAPMAVVIVVGLAALLGAMADRAGQLAMQRVGIGLGVLWVIDLVCLLVAQSINALTDSDD
ncbi:MAG: hypothetical protein ACOY3P_22090 [Planctomycetota bacterium]